MEISSIERWQSCRSGCRRAQWTHSRRESRRKQVSRLPMSGCCCNTEFRGIGVCRCSVVTAVWLADAVELSDRLLGYIEFFSGLAVGKEWAAGWTWGTSLLKHACGVLLRGTLWWFYKKPGQLLREWWREKVYFWRLAAFLLWWLGRSTPWRVYPTNPSQIT